MMNSQTLAMNKLSKENLLKLISIKDVSVTFSKENEKNHASKVWSNFNLVFVKNVKQDYVMCDLCMSLITYKSATGTGGMQKHIESCPKKPLLINESNSNKISLYFNSTKNKSNCVSRKLKDEITNALTEFIIRDTRPFETVKGDGFVNLINVTLNAGHGLLDSSTICAADLLADPRTVYSDIFSF
jgi:hypothetical protein